MDTPPQPGGYSRIDRYAQMQWGILSYLKGRMGVGYYPEA
jgi:hypothetical protein